MLLKFLKFCAGILLLPVCVIVLLSLFHLIMALQPESAQQVPRSVWGLLIGFFLWIFLFMVCQKPVRTYVLGHELTHALWAAVAGARVSRLRVNGRGGSVQVSKSSFLISLAPYFFPFYTFCALILYAGFSLFYDQRIYEPFWLGLVGLTWAFHLTFTIQMLLQHQPDIIENGRLFSYVIILLFNAAGLCIWIVCMSSVTFNQLFSIITADSRMVVNAGLRMLQTAHSG
ncbi:MAG: hypothetical protein AB7T27_05070 [Kiritimatiellia bacterium]